jgi:hypothetical protein
MTSAALAYPAIVLALLVTGCSAPVSPSPTGSAAGRTVASATLNQNVSLPELPPWIAEPAVLPAGLLLGAPGAGWMDAESATSRSCLFWTAVRRRAR